MKSMPTKATFNGKEILKNESVGLMGKPNKGN